jgi:hypothetical protein
MAGQWEGTAPCDIDKGYVLTGAGVEAQYGLGIMVSKPLKPTYTDERGKTHEIGTGWTAVAEPVTDARGKSFITVHAVCACVAPDGCE